MLKFKKVTLLFLGLALLLSVQVSSAFAETPLYSSVKDLIGVDYKWSGTTAKGFDCSGFTMYTYQKFGIDLPHTSRGQAEYGDKVAKADLRAGDLVFFETGGNGISHVGIYLWDGKFIHAATNEGVTVDKLSEAYYTNHYYTARRVLSDEAYKKLTTDKNAKTDSASTQTDVQS